MRFVWKRSDSVIFVVVCIDFLLQLVRKRRLETLLGFFCRAGSWLLSESDTNICLGFDSVNISSG